MADTWDSNYYGNRVFSTTKVTASDDTPGPPEGETIIPYGCNAAQNITCLSMLKPYVVVEGCPILKLGKLQLAATSTAFNNLFDLELFLRSNNDMIIYQLLERIVAPTTSKFLLRYFAHNEKEITGSYIEPYHFKKLDLWVLKMSKHFSKGCYSTFVQAYFTLKGYK